MKGNHVKEENDRIADCMSEEVIDMNRIEDNV